MEGSIQSINKLHTDVHAATMTRQHTATSYKAAHTLMQHDSAAPIHLIIVYQTMIIPAQCIHNVWRSLKLLIKLKFPFVPCQQIINSLYRTMGMFSKHLIGKQTNHRSCWYYYWASNWVQVEPWSDLVNNFPEYQCYNKNALISCMCTTYELN